MHRHAKSCLLRYVVHQISLEKHLSWPSAEAPTSACLWAAAATARDWAGHLQRSLPTQTTPWHKLSWRTDTQVIFCDMAPAIWQELHLKLDFCETAHLLKIKRDLMLQFCLLCMYRGVSEEQDLLWVWVLLVQFESNLNRHTVIPLMLELKHVILLNLVGHRQWCYKIVSPDPEGFAQSQLRVMFSTPFSFLNGGQGCSETNTESCFLSSFLLQRQKCRSRVCRMHNCFLCWQCQLILIYVNESTDFCNEDMNLRIQYRTAQQIQILVLILLLPSCLTLFGPSFHPYVVSYSDDKWELLFLAQQTLSHVRVFFTCSEIQIIIMSNLSNSELK